MGLLSSMMITLASVHYAFYGPGILQTCNTAIMERDVIYPYLADEKTETLKRRQICPRSHS